MNLRPTSETLNVQPSSFEKEQSQQLLGNLMVRAIQHNYIEMMQAYENDAKRVDLAMHRLFGESWLVSKEQIFQWFDKEYTSEVR